MTSQLFQSPTYETEPKCYSPPNLNAMSDLSDICRICGANNLSLIPLFGQDAQKNELVEKINKYLPITVHQQDTYPLGICQLCANTVLNWHELAQCCIKTEKALTLKLKANTQTVKCSGHHTNVQASCGSGATRGEAHERLSAPCLILIIKEVLNNVYFKIMNMDEENSDLIYVCQMCPDKAASTSIDSLCDHLIANHNRELNDKASVEAFIKENITFEEVLTNDGVTDDESEDQVADIPNYFCPFCESAFSSPTRLICHLNKHIEVSIDDGVLCCDHLYADKKSFVAHLQDKHVNRSTEGTLICKSCGLVEKDHDALAVHVNEKHAEVKDPKKKTEPNLKCQKFIPAVCPECNKSFSNKYNMLTHMKAHTSELSTSKFMCIKCNKTHNYSDFSDSSTSENEETGTQESLNSFDDLTHSNMRKDKMDEETRLELSQVQTKINGKVYFTCATCGKNLSSTHTYIFHKRIHTGERPCVCHICGKQFRTPNGLQRHLTETHEKQRRYICVMCHKNFANSQNLKQHMRIHTGERPFVCPHCGKRFTQSGSLHVHLKTHSEHYPHHCAECGAKFRLRSGLTRHRFKHTGERPHACAHCGKAFRQKHELNSHVLTHSDTKPHACAVCGTAFRQRRALRHHCKRLHEADARDVTHTVYGHAGHYE
ncbi:zinc finger protein 345-like isoform X1 [Vanessa atalanta]|uniref:zinc finger protein 345-like isoform X1 n=1 Tax=Vanessa atalanta TaxID=42275 RepID=UPI001FCDD5A7|nr:zinc finger protein 345-like isoform X1 [Vanessa atalanta]